MKRDNLGLKMGIVLAFLLGCQASWAKVSVDVYQLNNDSAKKGLGEKIGTVSFSDSGKGLEIKTDLKDLQPGHHGFHIHEFPSCEGAEKEGKWVAGGGAGSHLDPQHTGHHLGPNGDGHLGDLPFITVNEKGHAKETLYAKRLKVSDLSGHSIMIHKGADNYSDIPPMGGGGDRIACGVIK